MLTSKIHILLDRSPRQLYQYLYREILNQPKLRNFDDAHPCVFVLSTGRVGTKTLAALLGSAKNVLTYHEPSPKLFGLARLAYEHTTNEVTRKIFKETFLATRNTHFQYALSCGKGYVETSPQVTFLAPIILDIFSKAKFIHLVRSPGEVVRSGMRRNWYAGHHNDKTRIEPIKTEQREAWHNYTPFQKNLWLWNETNRWILEFSSTLPANQIILVRSEDIFSGQKETISAIFSFIHAPAPPKHKVNRVLGKKLNKQRTGIFPKPSNWTDEMYQDLITITGKTAEMLGYNTP